MYLLPASRWFGAQRRFGELEPVSPWVGCVKTPYAGQSFIRSAWDSRFFERAPKAFDIARGECYVRFSGWPESGIDADMNLFRTYLKPAAAPGT